MHLILQTTTLFTAALIYIYIWWSVMKHCSAHVTDVCLRSSTLTTTWCTSHTRWRPGMLGNTAAWWRWWSSDRRATASPTPDSSSSDWPAADKTQAQRPVIICSSDSFRSLLRKGYRQFICSSEINVQRHHFSSAVKEHHACTQTHLLHVEEKQQFNDLNRRQQRRE